MGQVNTNGGDTDAIKATMSQPFLGLTAFKNGGNGRRNMSDEAEVT